MKKILFILGCFFLLTSINSASAQNWAQVNTDGFGDANNQDSWAMTVYNNNLYMGTWNSSTGTEVWTYNSGTSWTQVNTSGFGVSTDGNTSEMIVYNNFLHVATGASKIWRTAAVGGPPYTDWTQVNTDGFGDPNNSSIDSMAVYNNQLYVGVNNFTTGGQVWRTSAGGGTPYADWTQVNTDGFGDSDNKSITCMVVYNNQLYAGTFAPFSGEATVWAYNGVSWTQVRNFGDSNTKGITSMAVYNNQLYVATLNWATGTEVWRTAGIGGPPYTDWTQVNTDGFGDSNLKSTWYMTVFNNRLYAGTSDNTFYEAAPPTIEAKVWEYQGGNTWIQVNSAGFGDSNNIAAASMAVYNNNLFVATTNPVTGVEVWTQLQTLADSILFPWVVQSDDVTTVISVVNTAETWAESFGLPFHDNRIHVEYWHKLTTANDQEEKCREYNFEVTSSKDDMVTWDMAGHFNSGLPMFNDTSNEVIGVPDMTLAVENPRRAFLIVDNYTDALTDAGSNVDGTMYGEATIIEHKTGAAWGYIGYNAIGGPQNFSDSDYRDQQGEVIGASETTQTTLLNPNDATTKLFVTPTCYHGYDEQGLKAQRLGNLNTIVQLCRFPEINGDDDPYTGNCESGGIWNNEEGGFSFTVEKNIVCTTADNIVDFFGGAGTSAYAQWIASGKAGWAYLITQPGNIDNRDGTEAFEETDEAIIGKLEYGTGLSWDGSIADTINTFVWLRDNANYLEHCAENPTDWRCAPGGINIIHNEYYQEEEITGACCIYEPTYMCLVMTEAECAVEGGSPWFEGSSCSPDPCE